MALMTVQQPPVQDAGARRGIGVFLAIAFGLAWLPFLPVLLGGAALPPVLMPLAPAIASVVVRRWVTREGFGDAGLRLDLRRRWPLLLVAALWPVLAAPLSVAVAIALGLAPTGLTLGGSLGHLEPAVVVLWMASALLLAPIILGEELGWRGYLQLRLFPGRPVRAAVATGLLWGVWHYPWLFSMSERSTGSTFLMVGMFTVATVYASVFLGWLQARSGSVWAPTLGHAANNGPEDSLTRGLFSGPAATTLGVSASFAVLIAEAAVQLGVVAADTVRRRRVAAR